MRKQSRIHTVVIAGPGIMGASFAQIFAKWYDRVYLYGCLLYTSCGAMPVR